MKKKSNEVVWLDVPEEHGYPAAASYLALTSGPKRVEKLIFNLRKAKVSHFKAKDIFRASGLSLLGVSNSHVEKDRKKIQKRIALSPLLLVRDNDRCKIFVADGYHRLGAVYSINEDALIPCQIV